MDEGATGFPLIFLPMVTYASGTATGAVAIADLNGFGKPDLAVVNYDNSFGSTGSVTVLLGNGDGTFQPPVSYPVLGAEAVAIADVNGDGKCDLVGDRQYVCLRAVRQRRWNLPTGRGLCHRR